MHYLQYRGYTHQDQYGISPQKLGLHGYYFFFCLKYRILYYCVVYFHVITVELL